MQPLGFETILVAASVCCCKRRSRFFIYTYAVKIVSWVRGSHDTRLFRNFRWTKKNNGRGGKRQHHKLHVATIRTTLIRYQVLSELSKTSLRSMPYVWHQQHIRNFHKQKLAWRPRMLLLVQQTRNCFPSENSDFIFTKKSFSLPGT